tara:strand:+ start:2800 stop:4542 length:1743 start_codon:yes stop_codon:yes gene_type:complete
MFDHLFENRNTTVTNLLKLSDCLGRSLRENIELFSIDGENKSVAYLSESGKVISGNYQFSDKVTFNNIKVQDSAIFTDNEIFDSTVNEKISSFVGTLNSDQYGNADINFTDVLSLWENRLKFENVKKNLSEKSLVFSQDHNIVNTDEFQRFLEVFPQVTDFLTEEKESIQKIQEIENAIKLSNSVSKAFNFPRMSYTDLADKGSYTLSTGLNKSVYELICKQELVKKELLESKKNFEDVWATNPKIRQLASLIFEDSDEVILESLVKAVVEIPFLALTTKKQLTESMDNAFSISDDSVISTKELKSFVSKLFEMKKPLKQIIINTLNEKYGINIQNLKESSTFKGLANTQVVIFEALARLAPKGSVVKETLSELSNMLKSKNGVEVIDVNETLQNCFELCEYTEFVSDFTLVEGVSFDDLLDQETSVVDLLEKAKENQQLLFDKKKRAELEDNLSPEAKKKKKEAEKDEKSPECEADEEDDSVRAAEAAAPFSEPAEFSKAAPFSADGESSEEEEEEDMKEEVEEPQADDQSAEMGQEEEEAPLSKEEFLDALKDLDSLMSNLSPEQEDSDSEDEEEEES